MRSKDPYGPICITSSSPRFSLRLSCSRSLIIAGVTGSECLLTRGVVGPADEAGGVSPEVTDSSRDDSSSENRDERRFAVISPESPVISVCRDGLCLCRSSLASERFCACVGRNGLCQGRMTGMSRIEGSRVRSSTANERSLVRNNDVTAGILGGAYYVVYLLAEQDA